MLLHLAWAYFKQLTGSGVSFRTFAKYLRDSMDIDAKTFATAFESMVQNGYHLRDGFSKLTCPVLVVRGARDFFVNDTSVTIIRDAIPHAETIVLDCATHYPNAEKSAEFNHILNDFLLRGL